MTQKICLISFDHWDYDYHIVNELNNQGFESYHIKISNYKHLSIKDKITNAFSKLFLKKNLKKIRRQEAIIKQLDRLGFQDQILIINPELVDYKYHLEIKKRTKSYKAYLYDSVKRNPINHLLDGIFDEIYSFDKYDIEKYNFKKASNYIYLPVQSKKSKIEYEVLFVGSLDERIYSLIKLGDYLKSKKISFKFIVIGKRKKLKKFNLSEEELDLIEFQEKKINQEQLIEFYKKCNIIVDLVRKNQTGLSFRFFEAMPLQKRIITNNLNVKNYSFYNTNNILIIDDDKIPDSFFENKFEKLSTKIYNNYTISSWVKRIFDLN